MGYSKSPTLAVCKMFTKSRAVKNLLKVGRPEKFVKIFEGHVTFSVLEPLMWVHNHAFISS